MAIVALLSVNGWSKTKVPQATEVVAVPMTLATEMLSLQLNFKFTPEAFCVVHDKSVVPPDSICVGKAAKEVIVASSFFIPRTTIELLCPWIASYDPVTIAGIIVTGTATSVVDLLLKTSPREPFAARPVDDITEPHGSC